LPQYRFQLALESVANGIYSLCEVAARLAWSVDQRVPRTFHRLRDKVRDCSDEPFPALSSELGDLTWYDVAREIRTEWTHHSPSFIGEKQGEPIVVVRAKRQKKDQEAMRGQGQIAASTVKASLPCVNASCPSFRAKLL
jgi:hypothetical protein